MRWKIFALLLCFWLITPSFSYASTQDIDTIRSRMIDFYSSMGASMESESKTFRDNLKPDGLWPDLDLSKARQQREHAYRIYRMSIVYSWNKDESYIAAINKAMPNLFNYINESLPVTTTNDWYAYEVAIPTQLGPALIFSGDRITPDNKTKAIAAIRHLLTLRPIEESPFLEGANGVWYGMGRLYFGILTGEESYLETAKQVIDSKVFISPGFDPYQHGIKPDGSYHFHASLNTGGYGAGFIVDCAKYAVWTDGTSYKLNADKLDILGKYTLSSPNWISYKGYFDLLSNRRGITDQSKDGNYGLYAALLLSQTSTAYKTELEKMSSRLISELSTSHPPLSTYKPYIDKIKSQNVPVTPLNGHIYYPYTDYTVHRNNDFYFSIKASSVRNAGGEFINPQGKKLWYTGHGFTFLTLNGQDYYTNDFLPTFNWQYVPGTTVNDSVLIPGKGINPPASLEPSDFVGGVTTGQDGVTAMNFHSFLNPDLYSKKSWFFMGDTVIAMGAGISCASCGQVYTTVDQRRLNSISDPVYFQNSSGTDINGEKVVATNYVYANNIGYIFPNSPSLVIRKLTQTGTWEEIGAGDSEVRKNAVYTLFLKHGQNPENAQYLYAFLPSKPLDYVKNYDFYDHFVILANNNKASAIKDIDHSAVGIVFWQPATIDRIQSFTPSIVYYKQQGQQIHFSVSEPTGKVNQIKLQLGGKYSISSNPSVNLSYDPSTDRTTLLISVKNGETTSFTLNYLLGCNSFTDVWVNQCYSFNSTSPQCQSDKEVTVNFNSSAAAKYRLKTPLDPSTYCSDPDNSKFATLTSWQSFVSSTPFTFTNVGTQKVCVQFEDNTSSTSVWCGATINVTGNSLTTPTPSLIGDANSDQKVDFSDYTIWHSEYLGIKTTKASDFNKDNKIDMTDYGLWHKAYLKL